MQQSVLVERTHIKLGDDWMSIILFNMTSGEQFCSDLVVYKEIYINYSILFKWDIHFILSNYNFIKRIIWARSRKTFAKLSGKQNRKNTGQDRIKEPLGATFTYICIAVITFLGQV